MAKTMVRFNCNFCNYNLLVTDALEVWASAVITKHVNSLHPKVIEALRNDSALKERLHGDEREGQTSIQETQNQSSGDQTPPASGDV